MPPTRSNGLRYNCTLWYSVGMTENGGNPVGAAGFEPANLLGVNDEASGQSKAIQKTVEGVLLTSPRFVPVSSDGPVRIVPTLDADDLKMMAALDFGSPGPPLKFPKPPEGHMVYFVGGETGPVKIGFTQQPIKERLKCIQNGSPVKLYVLATQPARRQREGVYHRQFAKYRLHGEWFERSPEIQAEIDRLNA
jgi:hypothetical protein